MEHKLKLVDIFGLKNKLESFIQFHPPMDHYGMCSTASRKYVIIRHDNYLYLERICYLANYEQIFPFNSSIS